MKLLPILSLTSLLVLSMVACSDDDSGDDINSSESTGDGDAAGDGDTAGDGDDGNADECLFDCDDDEEMKQDPVDPETPPELTIDNPGKSGALSVDGAWATSGDWAGWFYGFGSDGVITVPDSFAVGAGDAACTAGRIPADPNWQSYAGFGYDLEGDMESSDPTPAVSVTGEGIRYDIVNVAGNLLRLQLEGEDGARWCVDLTKESGVMSWSDFRVDCWEEDTESFDPHANDVVSLYVAIPGNNASDTDFEFCVRDLSEENPGTLGAGGAGGGTGG